jgi:hypothetical protein
MGEGILLDSGMIIFGTTLQPWKFQILPSCQIFQKTYIFGMIFLRFLHICNVY